MRVVGLEIGMHVLFIVFWIVKFMKARAGVVEQAGIGDFERIAALCQMIFFEIEGKITLEILLRRFAIERDSMDLFGNEIKLEVLYTSTAIVELDNAVPPVLRGVLFQGEFKGVADIGNQVAAGFSRFTGENVFSINGICHVKRFTKRGLERCWLFIRCTFLSVCGLLFGK